MSKRPRPPPSTAPQRDNVVRNSLVAGSVAGVASTLAMYPFDVIRTKMQTSGMITGSSSSSSSSSPGSSVYRGPLQVVRHTLQHGGARALYTGMAPVLAAQGVYKATVFAVNNRMHDLLMEYHHLEHHRQGLLDYEPLPTLLDRFWCGAVAGAVNAFLFVTPVEFIRNQRIAQHTLEATTASRKATTTSFHHHSNWGVISRSVSQHGWASLWRGAGWSVARDGWGCGWFFVAMAATQQSLTPLGETPSYPITVFSGGVAGLAFWVTSLPLDTVKTWVQSADLATSVSVKQSIVNILDQQGPRGVFQQLFRGWQVAFGRGIPSAAITISVYSHVYKVLDPSRG